MLMVFLWCFVGVLLVYVNDVLPMYVECVIVVYYRYNVSVNW